jgi:hypothetical protein
MLAARKSLIAHPLGGHHWFSRLRAVAEAGGSEEADAPLKDAIVDGLGI